MGDDGAAPRRDGGRRIAQVLPVLLIVGGIFFDVATPASYTASPLFAASPLVAAPFFSPLYTLLVGVGALAAEAGLQVYNGTFTEIPSVTEMLTVLTVAVMALFINQVVRRGSARLASARVVAEAAQRAVLPSPAARIGDLQIAARYEAAQADAFIGGDLFAVQDTPYGVRLVVGDVRGKGLNAVEEVAVVLGAFREAAEQEPTLEGVAQRLERALKRGGTRRSEPDVFEGFTTALLAEIPRGVGRVRVVNRGHPPPLVLHADGVLDVLEPSEPALPLGMGDVGTWPDRVDEAALPAGATLLLYTDGLSEARDEHGTFYDPRERLSGRIFPGPEELLDAVVADVQRHTNDGSTDDMALLAVSRPGERQPERRRTMPVVP
ncbi:PP2C family protein-serine/threonine phosphatase [Streptomyces sp. NPDC002133]|uniref:PP2C family protein-serine/threonine phosphatase n=1 Tax=Streptomyces sp. NPDC002133 TaxID=3154409 RepID=UPI00332A9613